MKVIIILLIFIIIFLNLISTEMINNTEHMENVTSLVETKKKQTDYFQEIDQDNKILLNFEKEFKKKIQINDPYTISYLFRLNNILDYVSEYPIILYSVRYSNEQKLDDEQGFIIYLQRESQESKEPADLKLIFYHNDTIIKEYIVSKYSFAINSKEREINSISDSSVYSTLSPH